MDKSNISLKGYYKEFEGLTDEGKVKRMCEELEKAGIRHEKCKTRRGAIIEYYMNEKTVFAVRELPNKGEKSFIILDRDFYDRHLADGKGTLYYNDRGGGNYKVLFQDDRMNNKELCRYVMEEAGIDIGEDCVDHIFHSPFINTKEALRKATRKDNRGNCKFLKHRPKEGESLSRKEYKEFTDCEKREYNEFAYNPLTDFTDTWYAYAAYKMLGIGSQEELEEYNREFIIGTDEDTAKYYGDVLGYDWEEA